jgi:hypothetical protein
MNPIQETTNEYITEIKFNVKVILDAIDLGPPPPQMIRTHSHNEIEEEEMPLITDGSFPNTPSEFEMPQPCERCYTFSCNGLCSDEMVLIPRQLSFEEEMDLPPPPPFTRMYTNAHLPYDVPADELLVTLSEAESNARDEYEEAFFKELEDKKQDQDQDK